MEKPLSRIGSEKKELNKIQIYLREKCLAQMYSVRHFTDETGTVILYGIVYTVTANTQDL